MAKVTSAYVTYDSTTNRESLSNTIYDISPFDVPIMSAIGKNNVSNRTFDWSTDSLPAVSTSSEIEGFELTRSTVAPQTRQTNGILEALNGLFQAAKRKARGYKRFSTMRTVLFLIAGKLDFPKINNHAA